MFFNKILSKLIKNNNFTRYFILKYNYFLQKFTIRKQRTSILYYNFLINCSLILILSHIYSIKIFKNLELMFFLFVFYMVILNDIQLNWNFGNNRILISKQKFILKLLFCFDFIFSIVFFLFISDQITFIKFIVVCILKIGYLIIKLFVKFFIL